MKLRTIALAVALAFGVTGMAEARQHTHHPKSRIKVKKSKKYKKYKYTVKTR